MPQDLIVKTTSPCSVSPDSIVFRLRALQDHVALPTNRSRSVIVASDHSI